jgi:UDP-2,3-diacylglucosamine hydrolase
MSRGQDLVFIGDAHLEEDGHDVEDFLSLLRRLGATASRLVLMGDLFNLWIGDRRLEKPHQTRVIEALAALRAGGVSVRYLEGNRDYRVHRAYAGWAVDEATGAGIEERAGGRRLFAIHGDLANAQDRLYTLWRGVSRSAAAWGAFRLLPRSRGIRVADALERGMRGRNLAYKAAFPEAVVRDYAAGFLARGFDAVVLGHFHVEKDLEARPPSSPGRILVLPEWKSSRRHLRVGPDGGIAFVDSG